MCVVRVFFGRRPGSSEVTRRSGSRSLTFWTYSLSCPHHPCNRQRNTSLSSPACVTTFLIDWIGVVSCLSRKCSLSLTATTRAVVQ